MQNFSVRIAIGDGEQQQVVQVSGSYPEPPSQQVFATAELVGNTCIDLANLERIKIAADGSHLPADYAGTDHVAVLIPALGIMHDVESVASPSGEGMLDADIESACRARRTAGYSDWRPATRLEAMLIIDDTRCNPAVDPTWYPRIKPNWHRTNSPYVGAAAYAWGVYFGGGFVYDGRRNNRGFGLAVRRAGQ